MRTSCAIRPRKGSRVSRRTEASTPCLCNSSTTSPRHFRPNPFLARYQPPPAIAPKIRTTRNRAVVARKRRANVCGRCVVEANDFCGGSRIAGMKRGSVEWVGGAEGPVIERLNSSTLQRDFRFRFTGNQCHAQFCQYHFHFCRLVFYPAKFLATPRRLHGYSDRFLRPFSRWLYHLSHSRRGKIFRLSRLAGGNLF